MVKFKCDKYDTISWNHFIKDGKSITKEEIERYRLDYNKVLEGDDFVDFPAGIVYTGGNLMFYSTIMKIDSIDRLRDIRDALLVEQGINPTRQGEQAIKVVVERIDEIQATLDKSATKNLNRRK